MGDFKNGLCRPSQGLRLLTGGAQPSMTTSSLQFPASLNAGCPSYQESVSREEGGKFSIKCDLGLAMSIRDGRIR